MFIKEIITRGDNYVLDHILKWEDKFIKDFGDYVETGFPVLQRTRMERVLGQTVHASHSVHLGAFRKTAESEVRVATIGRTFLEMLREPALCGGIQHVLGA